MVESVCKFYYKSDAKIIGLECEILIRAKICLNNRSKYIAEFLFLTLLLK